MQDLFSNNVSKSAPLADRMRPQTLDEFIGQRHIVGEGCLLRRAIKIAYKQHILRPTGLRKNNACFNNRKHNAFELCKA